MSLRFVLILILLLLLCASAGCATVPPQIIKVPVPVPCKQDIGADPSPIATYASLSAQKDLRERLKLAIEQLIQDAGRLGQYRVALAAC